MDKETLSIVLWVGAGLLLLVLIMRRRKRKALR
jgi:LPXTG-motif cell wall-anchored protein